VLTLVLRHFDLLQDKYTALSVAQEGGHKEIVAMLSKLTLGSESPSNGVDVGAGAISYGDKSARIPIVTPVTSPHSAR
jgi:hypothetical protein